MLFICQSGLTPLIPFIRLLNILGKFRKLHWLSWISKFLSVATVYVPVCTTNLQILTVIILLYSSSHPSHVKNSIHSQFLRLRRLCSDDSDFSSKSEEMCQFFEQRGYPVSVVKAGHHRAQQSDRQSALQASQKDKNGRIPFTLTFHPHNHAVKSISFKPDKF